MRLLPFICQITILMILGVAAVNCQAQDLFNNGAPTTTGFGDYAATGNTLGDGAIAGNVFSPSKSGTANEIIFYGGYQDANSNSVLPPTSDDFTITLYNVGGSGPTTVIETSTITDLNRTPLGAGFPSDEYSFSGILADPFALSTGTSYYLGVGDSSTPYDLFYILGTQSPGPAQQEYSYFLPVPPILPGGFTNNSPQSLSFDLESVVVPEPSTPLLFLIGFAFLGLASIRRCRFALLFR